MKVEGVSDPGIRVKVAPARGVHDRHHKELYVALFFLTKRKKMHEKDK